MKKQLTHEQFAAIILRLNPTKDALQKRFNEGLTIAQFGTEIGQCSSTAKTVLNSPGIKSGHGLSKTQKENDVTARVEKLEERVAFIAESLGIKFTA